jgi:hypothetical protein
VNHNQRKSITAKWKIVATRNVTQVTSKGSRTARPVPHAKNW